MVVLKKRWCFKLTTYTKNIHYLKEAIFSKLTGDATLVSLLGGNGRIFHRSPPQDAKYPCIAYGIINDRENPFGITQDTGAVTESYFRITIFSKSSKTEETDNIEARIKELLNGQRTLDNSTIICYSCFRDNLLEPIKDPDLLVWITPIRYRVRWATKSSGPYSGFSQK